MSSPLPSTTTLSRGSDDGFHSVPQEEDAIDPAPLLEEGGDEASTSGKEEGEERGFLTQCFSSLTSSFSSSSSSPLLPLLLLLLLLLLHQLIRLAGASSHPMGVCCWCGWCWCSLWW